jgi:hypothetical protein
MIVHGAESGWKRRVHGWEDHCGPGGRLVRAMARGKKLFRWREVLVVIDLNRLPDGSLWKKGWKWSVMIFHACFLALESCKTSMEGRWQPMTLSADPDNLLKWWRWWGWTFRTESVHIAFKGALRTKQHHAFMTTPEWCSGLCHWISVLEAPLQTLWFEFRLHHNRPWLGVP